MNPSESKKGERIAKRLSRAGVCSRRDAEKMIAEGRISVGGRVIVEPGTLVMPADFITVDGKAIPDVEPTRLWRFHKPAGFVTTARDEMGRPTIFDLLPPDFPRTISIGRLDLSSEGLILLTNDGELARKMELPSTGWVRHYRARAFGRVTQARLDTLADGCIVDKVVYGPIKATLEREQGDNVWVSIAITEGKNREVRRLLESVGLKVGRLIRTSYGPFQLGNLTRGHVEEVPRRVVREQMGDKAP